MIDNCGCLSVDQCRKDKDNVGHSYENEHTRKVLSFTVHGDTLIFNTSDEAKTILENN